MSDDVGPLRTRGKLSARARHDRRADRRRSASGRSATAGAFDMRRLDWFDLRNMLLVARAVAQAALARTESRGAHQREDFPEMLPDWRVNQVVAAARTALDVSQAPAAPVEVAAQ